MPFATISRLKEEILENDVTAASFHLLPDLDSLDFSEQVEKDYHPVILRIGNIADEASIQTCRLYIYLKRGNRMDAAPGINIIMNNTPATEGKKAMEGDDDEGTPIHFERLRPMVTSGHAVLYWPFRELIKSNEFRGVVKYCFIKAAEAGIYGFNDHRIPHNISFVDALCKAISRLQTAKENGADEELDTEAYEKMSRIVEQMQKSPSRKSDLSKALKRDVKRSDELTPVYDDPPARRDAHETAATDGRAASQGSTAPPLNQRLLSATDGSPNNPLTHEESTGIYDEDYFMEQTASQSTFSDSIETDNEDDDPGRAVSDHVARLDPPDELHQPSKSPIHNSAVPSFFHSRAAKTQALRANMEQKSRLTGVRPASTRAKSTSDMTVLRPRRTHARLTSATLVSKAHRREMKMRADGLLGRRKVLEDSLVRKRKKASKENSTALKTSIAKKEKEARNIDKLVEKMLYEALGSVSETEEDEDEDEDEDEETMVEESV